ncbi:hypothetical protein D9M73_231660 [compost metagenome]
MPDAGIDHGLQQGKGGCDVVLVVLAGCTDRLAHLNERGEVKHRIEVAHAKQHIQCGFVGDVELGPLDTGAR